MSKIKFIAGSFGVFALLLGAVAMAQTTSTPAEVQQAKFFREKGRIAGWNAGQISIQVTGSCTPVISTLPSALVAPTPVAKPEEECFGDKTISVDLSKILLLGASDDILSPAAKLKIGQPVYLYYQRSGDFANFYMVKYMGPLGQGAPQYLCTQDAKQCPNGTWVGRTGPKCEFICTEEKVPDTNSTVAAPPVAGQVFTICASVTKTENGVTTTIGGENCRTIKPGLKQGLRNEEVLQLQKKLQEKGLLPQDSATGFFGNATLRAVKELQKSLGLPTTGFVGPQTLQKLEAEND